MTLDDKIKEAERTLKLGAEMSAYYYHKPLIICYSGGKDSHFLYWFIKEYLKRDDIKIVGVNTYM